MERWSEEGDKKLMRMVRMMTTTKPESGVGNQGCYTVSHLPDYGESVPLYNEHGASY